MNQKLCMTALMTASLLFGCGKQEKPAENPTGTPTNAGSAVASELKDLALVTQQFVAESKDQFTASMTGKLEEWDRKLEALNGQINTLSAETKDQATKALDTLRLKRDLLSMRIDQLKGAGQDAWQQLKTEIEAAAKELEKDYETAKARFSS